MKVDALTRYTYIFVFLDILLLAAAVLTLIVVLGWYSLLGQAPAPNEKIITRLTVSGPFVNGPSLHNSRPF